MDKNLLEAIKFILTLTIPYIKELINSKVVPMVKRKYYEKVDTKIDTAIKDLAQNASKIPNETNEIKKQALIDGTNLGVATLKAFAEKLNKAANEIEKAVNK